MEAADVSNEKDNSNKEDAVRDRNDTDNDLSALDIVVDVELPPVASGNDIELAPATGAMTDEVGHTRAAGATGFKYDHNISQLRSHFTRLLVEAFQTDEYVISTYQRSHITDCANRMEGKAFAEATTREEYTGLVQAQIHKITTNKRFRVQSLTYSPTPPSPSPLPSPRTDASVRLRRGVSRTDRPSPADDRVAYFTQLSHDSSSQHEHDFEVIQHPENLVEALRQVNNYTFGFKKWKSHVTARPLSDRSNVVQSLYKDDVLSTGTDSHINSGNIIYVCVFGWWLSLLYLLCAALMTVTYVGRGYGLSCWKLAQYVFWPFGKYVQRVTVLGIDSPLNNDENLDDQLLGADDDDCPILDLEPPPSPASAASGFLSNSEKNGHWDKPCTYVWCVLCLPILAVAHCITMATSWMTVVFIPVAKMNHKMLMRVLLLPPDQLVIRTVSGSDRSTHSTIHNVIHLHKAANIYYYKYTVIGLNIIAVNLSVFVILAIIIGYVDEEHHHISPTAKFMLALLAIIPLAYYIGMAISSISAQSNFAVGAVMNATFGSIVEIVLYIMALVKGAKDDTNCYVELVKSALVGTLLATLLLIPGICMIVGGLKHSTQSFNPRSTGVGSTLLFISIVGIFAPTIFAKAYGTLQCSQCTNSSNMLGLNSTDANVTWGLQCSDCTYSIFGLNNNMSLYDKHIQPLVYVCGILLPVAYIIGLVFSLKTHRAHIYDAYAASINMEHSHGNAHWGRFKSFSVLIVATTLTSLCAEVVVNNIEDLIEGSSITMYFIGVTLLSLIPDIPEIVTGIQFALQNNINLSIEVGSCIAVQVCMLQIPVLILAQLIYEMNFYLVFSDIHLWAVVFAVFVMNFLYQDGMSNYFQGASMCFIYVMLIAMYFYAPMPTNSDC